MKVKIKEKTGAIRIDPALLKEVKFVCVRDETNIKDFVADAIKDRLKKIK
jgi:hypothetical protein